MLSMLPKETYTLEEFQKTLGELAEKIPERTAEGTAIKRLSFGIISMPRYCRNLIRPCKPFR